MSRLQQDKFLSLDMMFPAARKLEWPKLESELDFVLRSILS